MDIDNDSDGISETTIIILGCLGAVSAFFSICALIQCYRLGKLRERKKKSLFND